MLSSNHSQGKEEEKVDGGRGLYMVEWSFRKLGISRRGSRQWEQHSHFVSFLSTPKFMLGFKIWRIGAAAVCKICCKREPGHVFPQLS
ncbi:hypothetical protein IC582_003902 [Cucumis melo]